MKTSKTINRTLALAVVAAFAAMPFMGTASASEDEISVQCHYDYRLDAWASKGSVAPGESFTVYVRQMVGYYRDPSYVRAYSFSGDGWNHEFSWGPIWYTYCGYRTAAFTVTAPEEPGTMTVSAVAKSYSWPSLSSYYLRSNLNVNVIAPELQVERAMADEVTLGDDFRVGLTVRNVGQDTAVGTTLEELLPAGVDVLSGGDTATDARLAWELGDLAPGEEVTVAYTARALERGTSPALATASAKGSTGFPVAATSAPFAFTIVGPEVSFTRDFTQSVNAGEVFDVTVTYTNEGELPAKDVTLADTFHSDYTPVPADVRVENAPEPGVISPRAPRVEFVYGSPESDATADPVTVKNGDWTTFRWMVPELAPGDTVTVTYTLQAPTRAPYATPVVPEVPDAPADPVAFIVDATTPPDEYPVTVDIEETLAMLNAAVADPEAFLASLGSEIPEVPGVVGVEDNEASYPFLASASFATPDGFALDGAAVPVVQSVRPAHMTTAPVPDVDEPVPPL